MLLIFIASIFKCVQKILTQQNDFWKFFLGFLELVSLLVNAYKDKTAHILISLDHTK